MMMLLLLLLVILVRWMLLAGIEMSEAAQVKCQWLHCETGQLTVAMPRGSSRVISRDMQEQAAHVRTRHAPLARLCCTAAEGHRWTPALHQLPLLLLLLLTTTMTREVVCLWSKTAHASSERAMREGGQSEQRHLQQILIFLE
jgi:hypothetical protein